MRDTAHYPAQKRRREVVRANRLRFIARGTKGRSLTILGKPSDVLRALLIVGGTLVLALLVVAFSGRGVASVRWLRGD